MVKFSLSVVSFIFILSSVYGDELTFEVLDNAKICIYDEVENGTHIQLSAQVLSGGSRDIDITLTSPEGRVLQHWQRTERMNYDWTSVNPGHIAICFSNEFSSYTRKLVHFSLVRLSGSHNGLDELNRLLPLALANIQMSTIIEKLHHSHELMSAVVDHQHWFVVHSTQSAKQAELLNHSVDYWSILHTVVMITVGMAQVYAFRRLFSNKNVKNTAKSS